MEAVVNSLAMAASLALALSVRGRPERPKLEPMALEEPLARVMAWPVAVALVEPLALVLAWLMAVALPLVVGPSHNAPFLGATRPLLVRDPFYGMRHAHGRVLRLPRDVRLLCIGWRVGFKCLSGFV